MLINERDPSKVNPEFDSEASLREAISRMPIERVLEQHGCTPVNGSWKRIVCPFCKKKTSAGLFEATGSGETLFKCHSTSCPSGTKAMGPVEVIAGLGNLSRPDAFVAYLKMAGVWKERTKLRSDKPVKKIERKHEEVNKGELNQSAQTPENVNRETISAPPPEQSDGTAKETAPTPSEAHSQAGCATPSPSVPRADADNAGGTSSTLPGTEASSAPELSPTEEKKPDVNLAALFGGKVSEGEREAEGAKILRMDGSPMEPAKAGTRNDAEPSKAEAPEPDGYRSIREFFSLLTLNERDEQKLFEKRGLSSSTSEALRFRSSPKSNRDLLLNLAAKYPPPELLNSGLWLPEDRKRKKARRPNSQFCGAGIMRKLREGEEAAKGEWVDDDGNVWGWCEPVIIPYFDERGDLIGLRPHKGNGRSETLVGCAKIYIPRAPSPKPESFHTVVITEGEFKAAALWQTIGAGSGERFPVGVCALPGISFAKNYEIREQLDEWLRMVRCAEVIVAYDNEEKGDARLASYKADPRKRHDAQIYARYLATDLHEKLHIRGKVCVLPNEWRNENGKADWDGALAQFAAAYP
jgi:hypothetical protein